MRSNLLRLAVELLLRSCHVIILPVDICSEILKALTCCSYDKLPCLDDLICFWMVQLLLSTGHGDTTNWPYSY